MQVKGSSLTSFMESMTVWQMLVITIVLCKLSSAKDTYESSSGVNSITDFRGRPAGSNIYDDDEIQGTSLYDYGGSNPVLYDRKQEYLTPASMRQKYLNSLERDLTYLGNRLDKVKQYIKNKYTTEKDVHPTLEMDQPVVNDGDRIQLMRQHRVSTPEVEEEEKDQESPPAVPLVSDETRDDDIVSLKKRFVFMKSHRRKLKMPYNRNWKKFQIQIWGKRR